MIQLFMQIRLEKVIRIRGILAFSGKQTVQEEENLRRVQTKIIKRLATTCCQAAPIS